MSANSRDYLPQACPDVRIIFVRIIFYVPDITAYDWVIYGLRTMVKVRFFAIVIHDEKP